MQGNITNILRYSKNIQVGEKENGVFVEFATFEQAKRAIQATNGSTLDGKRIGLVILSR